MEIRRKDTYISEAIHLLDEHLSGSNYDIDAAYASLGKFELTFIDDEIQKCLDFRYYAENYHAINSKHEGLITLYPFFDSQEIFYEKIIEIQLQGRPVKVIVLKARQLGLCVSPDTLVLTSDLKWVRIDDIHAGQQLVSVDEHRPGGRGSSRKMRIGEVVAKREVFEPAFKLKMANGVTLISTGPHRWLSKVRGDATTCWRSVSDMRVGDSIRYITEPWGKSEYEDGWFGGLLDGEGSLRRKGGAEACVCQTLGEVYDRAFEYLKSRGYTFREDLDDRIAGASSKFGNKAVGKLVLSRMSEIFRLIGQTRPSRLLEKDWWDGKELPTKKIGEAWSKIISIEPLPPQRMIDLQTSTKTFIAEGFVSHNSTLSEALIFHRTIFTEGCTSLVVAQDPDQADYLFEMSRFAYDNLPWWMRPEARYEAKGRYLQFDRKDEMLRITKPGLRSQMLVEASNKMSGVAVGKALIAAHLSELSLWPDAKVLAENIFPTLSGTKDQLAIMESTARGRKNFWHDFWKASWEGKVDWTPVFIEFFRLKKYSLPIPKEESFEKTNEETALVSKIKETVGVSLTDEQIYWRRTKMQEFAYLNRGDESKFFQEYPGASWIESFQGSGICAFDKKKLQLILETTCAPPKWYGEINLEQNKSNQWIPKLRLTQRKKGELPPPQENPGARLYVWEQPEQGETYYIGADVAHGNYGGDFSCAQVIKVGKGPNPDVQVAEWHGWINPTPYGDVCVALGYWYNTAEIAVECNDVGQATNARVMRVLEYPNLFRWKHYDKVKNFISDFLGWYTNVKTRDLIIAKFREFIDDRMIIIRSEKLIDECFDFSSVDDSRFEGQSTHDDAVFSMMIAIFCAHDFEGFGNDSSVKTPLRDDPEVVCLCGHSKGAHGDGRFLAKCKECDCPVWRQKVDFINSDFSPTWDVGRKPNLHPNEAPEELVIHESISVGDDERWKLL